MSAWGDIALMAKTSLGASGGVRIQWYFENKTAMQATQKLFESKGVKGIEFIYKPRK